MGFTTVTAVGGVCTEITPKTVAGANLAEFQLAVSKKVKGEEKTDYYSVKAWREQADFAIKWFKKGSQIAVIGELAQDRWEKDGVKKEKTYINAQRFQFIDTGKPRSESGADTSYTKPPEFGKRPVRFSAHNDLASDMAPTQPAGGAGGVRESDMEILDVPDDTIPFRVPHSMWERYGVKQP